MDIEEKKSPQKNFKKEIIQPTPDCECIVRLTEVTGIYVSIFYIHGDIEEKKSPLKTFKIMIN